ncbi:hypothetical protein LTR56_020442 [Elasticomyces elasticus]|nr:hypothetical protein LTR56_020442 [Elasticomyces elasticus]KAK3666468.1 hypothetical protein LTR22_002773 [Elasticomyces elasticus]KAK4931288.1 hypothetical protein LTR49_002346 [Elasticomyces elasticus]KAK5767780.1 hypothetical protein LTS12_001932 [Elasticomyces elasticus]
MTTPVLVKAYNTSSDKRPGKTFAHPKGGDAAQALPPTSSYAFASILNSIQSPELSEAITGIAEICAKNRMSLADEYASHLPPVGDIKGGATAFVPVNLRPRAARRRALTSVPEASSGSSSEGSVNHRLGVTVRGARQLDFGRSREVRIGSMGRMVPVESTTAMDVKMNLLFEVSTDAPPSMGSLRPRPQRSASEAALSLRRLLEGQQVQRRPG